jgi:hypothetical protein
MGMEVPGGVDGTHPSFAERVSLLRGTFVGGPAWRAWPLVAAMFAVLGHSSWRWCSLRDRERGLLLSGAALMTLYFAVPLDLPGWQLVSPRFLPTAAALLLPLLPWERLATRQRFFVLGLQSVFVVAALGWTIRFHKDLRERMVDLDRGLKEDVVSYGTRLPIVLDPSAGLPLDWREAPYAFYEPALNAGALFAVEQGGIVPYTFTSDPKVHFFVISADGWSRFPPVPERSALGRAWMSSVARAADENATSLLNVFALFGSEYDDVILFSRFGSERALFEDRGYEVTYEHGRLAMMRFRGCPVRVALNSPGPVAKSFMVTTGWVPVFDMPAQTRVPPGEGFHNGWVATPMLRTPCGRVWIEAFVDEDGSSSLTPGDHVCVWGGKSERAVVTLTPESKVVPCSHLRPW